MKPLTYERNSTPFLREALLAGGIAGGGATAGTLGATIVMSSFNPYGGIAFIGLTALISSIAAPIFNKLFVRDGTTNKGFISDTCAFVASTITAASVAAAFGLLSPPSALIITAASIASILIISGFFAVNAVGFFASCLAKAFVTHS